MVDIDPNQIIASLIGGGAVWLAIKTEIRLLWREVDILREQIKELM